ncbi:MAG: hypothetical protein ACOCU4_04200 [Alkalispirochaeta sp.]
MAVGGLLLTGCPTGVDWSEYDGTNLLVEPQWYFADGLQAGTVNPVTGTTAPADFVALEEVSESDAGALPAGVAGPIYRYEVLNLLPQGDFEGIDNGDFGTLWNRNLNDDDPGEITIDSSDPILGDKSLSLATNGDQEGAWIDLDEHLIGGFPVNTGFAFNVDFRSQSTQFGMVLENGADGSVLNSWNITRGGRSVLTTFSFPGTFFDDPAETARANFLERDESMNPEPTRWSVGGEFDSGPNVINVSIDRLTVVRANQSHYVRASVPYHLEGRPDIVSGGSYELSMWVRQDPTAGSDNRMAARAISAGIDTSTNGDHGVTGSPNVARTVATEHFRTDDATDWTQLEFSVTAYVPSALVDAADDSIAFDVVIEIGNSNLGVRGQDAGSILIADPRLTWSP